MDKKQFHPSQCIGAIYIPGNLPCTMSLTQFECKRRDCSVVSRFPFHHISWTFQDFRFYYAFKRNTLAFFLEESEREFCSFIRSQIIQQKWHLTMNIEFDRIYQWTPSFLMYLGMQIMGGSASNPLMASVLFNLKLYFYPPLPISLKHNEIMRKWWS